MTAKSFVHLRREVGKVSRLGRHVEVVRNVDAHRIIAVRGYFFDWKVDGGWHVVAERRHVESRGGAPAKAWRAQA